MEGSSKASKPVDIKKLVNQIFATKGLPEVKNFPREFCDGSNSSDLTPTSQLLGAVQHLVR